MNTFIKVAGTYVAPVKVLIKVGGVYVEAKVHIKSAGTYTAQVEAPGG